ncbi:hypothetical protein [Achromobacter mucicolens]|uniref:hypothetical protein n=1 Tax=Achromobacter mucicolens TaxID=1389922 RepID=UPI002FE3C673
MKKTLLLASVCAALLSACAPATSPREGSSAMLDSAATSAATQAGLTATTGA